MGSCSRAVTPLAFLLVLLLTPPWERVTVAGQVVFPTAGACTLETGEAGRCVPLTDCPPVLQTFKQRPPVSCGFEGSIHIVCCPKDQDNITEPGHPSLDISPPPGYETAICGRSAIKRIETFGRSSRSTLSSLVRPKLPSVPLPLDASPIGSDIRQVVGGVISSRNAWPWVALLGQRDAAGINWFCGGVLINEYWVLSAHHCFGHSKADVVRLGEHDYANDNDGASHKDFGVQELVLYPDYKAPEAYHDLALLKLDSQVQLQRFILPVCLQWGKQSESKTFNTVATIVGWGNTLFGGTPSSVLMEANVQVFPSSRCDSSYSTLPNYDATWPRGIGDETLCAGDPAGGKDACQGDSGGPLVSRDGSGPYVLEGIVSRGYGCGNADYPGLYASLRHAPYLAWIKKVAFATQ